MSWFNKNNDSNNNDNDDDLLKSDRRGEQRYSERRKETGQTERDQIKADTGREEANQVAKYVADKEAGGKANREQREQKHRDISGQGYTNDELKGKSKK